MATKSRSRKTPLQLWVLDNRKRLGLVPSDLAAFTGVSVDTARAWESRGRPSEDALVLLESRFGVPRPSDETQDSDLAAAIRAQAAAIEGQANAIRDLTAEIRVAALAVLTGQEGTAELVAQLVDAARAGTLDGFVSSLRDGTPR